MSGVIHSHDIVIGGETTYPGERRRIQIPVANLPTQTLVNLPIEVVNGSSPGPRLWLSAAIHGDELNGIEIIHRVLLKVEAARLAGAIVAAPVVNVFGLIHRDRYLPDRRDLNRSFPGSPTGSLAARLAHLFMTEVVAHCTHGIDLHTASHHRTNLPQVRADLEDRESRRMAEAFAAPIMIHGEAPRGSLRDVVARRGLPIIVYEAGEPQRFNPDAITTGVRGVMRVLAELGMWRTGGRREARVARKGAKSDREVCEAVDHTWIRARRSGVLRLKVKLGESVERGQALGVIHDAFGEEQSAVTSAAAGLIIGHTNNPLVNQGDAIIHVARRLE